jgi:hypothetical protein
VEKLSHYWEALPAESPLRGRYAPPARPDARYWQAMIAILIAIALMSSGSVLLGLLVAVGGLIWGYVIHAGVQAFEASLAEWNAATICLACVGRF